MRTKKKKKVDKRFGTGGLKITTTKNYNGGNQLTARAQEVTSRRTGERATDEVEIGHKAQGRLAENYNHYQAIQSQSHYLNPSRD